MRHIDYIVWHTAADGSQGVDRDTTAAQIDRWHRDRGWKMIGYHYVIRKSGVIEPGRPEDMIGAHVEGLNEVSIGICFSGHGDIAPLTQQQVEAGIRLTRELMARYHVPVAQVIGHREINQLSGQGLHTSKTCPGTQVNMAQMRALLSAPAAAAMPEYDPETVAALITNLQGVYAAVQQLGLDETLDELNAFRRQPQIDAAIAGYRERQPTPAGP